jgi:hypothetical protein
LFISFWVPGGPFGVIKRLSIIKIKMRMIKEVMGFECERVDEEKMGRRA